MRTLLFVPGDSVAKGAKARSSEADVLILDLEDSVAADRKIEARAITREILEEARNEKRFFVRVNALDTGLTLADLAAVMPARPDGIMLPKSSGAKDVEKLSLFLDAFEAASDIAAGTTKIIAIATETAAALFGLATYGECGPRLEALMWGAEDLAASLGSLSNRDGETYNGPSLMARNLCLAAAAAAGVMAIDTVYTDIPNQDGLRTETAAARRDGFAAKAVIHPAHIAVVNEVFKPDDHEVTWARKVVELFADGSTGVLSLSGQMIDKPHLRIAERILSRI